MALTRSLEELLFEIIGEGVDPELFFVRDEMEEPWVCGDRVKPMSHTHAATPIEAVRDYLRIVRHRR